MTISQGDLRALRRLSFAARRTGGRKLPAAVILRALVRFMGSLDADLSGAESVGGAARTLLHAPLRRRRSQRGSTLLEAVLAVAIISLVGLSLLGLIQRGTMAAFKAREQATCTRMLETGFSRLKNIDFYLLFAADSQSSNYGLQASYPYKTVLDGLAASLAASKFGRFKVKTSFMRRDSSDANADGLNSDLIAFADSDSNLIDDYDPGIRYRDQNLDGDYYDTYLSGGRTVAEEPDTHAKQVTFEVYRNGRLVCSRSELITLEQFTGAPNPSSEAVLALLLSTPTNNANLYRALTANQIAARALAIDKAYPADAAALRADSGSPLPVSGETDPLAAVNLYLGTSGVLDSGTADMAGAFSVFSPNVTAALVEGSNLLVAQATKDAYTSPVTNRTLLLDLGIPGTSNPLPTGTADTLAPFVAVNLFDLGLATTAVSGICPDVITLKVGGTAVNHTYDSTTGRVVWIDSMTNTVPILSSAAYTAVIQAGDYAGYKTTYSWTFTLSVPDTDNSAPAVSNKSPIGMAGSQLPVISVRLQDNQSGINPLSLQMTLDGAVVVSSATIGSAYDPETGTVSYTPPAAFASGSFHDVEIRGSHFSQSPADKIESVDSWSFSVP